MHIFIPTKGRWTAQPTLEQLVKANIAPILVVQSHEYIAYEERWGHLAAIARLPEDIKTIAPTRQYILEKLTADKMVMLDDDLWFYHRREDDRSKLREITPSELEGAIDLMSGMLNEYPHVGFAAREGANRNMERLVYNTRIMRVLGYSARVLRREGIRFDEMQVMEDFHVALSLLERGYPNVVLNEYAHNQAGSGAAGGCSHFRTPEVQANAAMQLAHLHPGFVKVVQKETKSAWGGGTRFDVNISWKKAYDHGLQRHLRGPQAAA